ncbi:Leucine Rich repeats (2 copies)/TIR domain/Miro-like protein/Leucine rich repeat [Balamuthia mandrillaris]
MEEKAPLEVVEKKGEEDESQLLPALLQPFAHSTVCNLSNKGLTSLPSAVERLSTNPQEFGKLTSLTWCFLRNNNLTALPPEFGQLSALTRCSLSNNRLSSLPRDFGQLRALSDCNLSNNNLTALPAEFGQLGSLSDYACHHNHLQALPPEFGQLSSLTRCNLSHNKLSSLPREFGQLHALYDCDLRGNELSSVPREFGHLRALTRCNLSCNKLTSLPREFGQLIALSDCDLCGNELSSVPREFGHLRALTRCNLSCNKLSFLPREFGQLIALTYCDLYENPLAALPCTVAQLLPRMRMHSTQPFHRQEALLSQTEENDEEAKKNHTTVNSLRHLSGEAVLMNNLLPTGLLRPVPDSPFAWLSSPRKERTTKLQNGTTTERKEGGEGSVEIAKVVLPEEVKERLERLQRRCDVCEQLFLEAEAEEEEEESQPRQIVRRFWDQERGVWWELLCCCQSCRTQPLAGYSLATK